MLELNGKPIICHMIDRLKSSSMLDRIIICTSANPQDRPLVDIARNENIDYYLGSEEDVILRLYEAAKKFKLDYVLNVTADCPLVSLEYLEEIVNKYIETNADFIRCLDLPIGLAPYGLKIEAMRKVCEIKRSEETEVWGRYFTDSGLFSIVNIDIPLEYIRPDYRLTLDYPEDFKFFQNLFEHFGEDTCKTPMPDIIKYLDETPEVVKINKHCQELYRERWESQGRLTRWNI